MFFKSKQLLGLDIGSNSVKLAVIELKKGRGHLDGFYFVPTPGGSIQVGEIQSPPKITSALGSLIQQAQTKKKNICVGVWGSGVIIKKIQVPKMDKKLLEEQVKFEAEQYIPFNLDEVNIEFIVLKQQDPNSDSLQILIIAVKKDIIMNLAESIESAGLNLSTLDLSGIALSNCFEFNYPNPGVSHIGLVDIGHTNTNFVVRLGRDLVFVRDVPFGGKQYTQEIQNKMGVSYEEAENLKLSSGSEDCPPDVLEVIETVSENFIEELTRTIDFYMTSSSSSSPIQRYYITGGSSALGSIKEKIEKSFEAQVEHLNPFTNIDFNPNNINPEYLAQIMPYAPIAIGLGLRTEGDEK